jgi:hypothetical protein
MTIANSNVVPSSSLIRGFLLLELELEEEVHCDLGVTTD